MKQILTSSKDLCNVLIDEKTGTALQKRRRPVKLCNDGSYNKNNNMILV